MRLSSWPWPAGCPEPSPVGTVGLFGSGTYISRQRVSLDLVNPPEGALEEIADLVPDPSAVCVEVTRTPQPPSGPLDL